VGGPAPPVGLAGVVPVPVLVLVVGVVVGGEVPPDGVAPPPVLLCVVVVVALPPPPPPDVPPPEEAPVDVPPPLGVAAVVDVVAGVVDAATVGTSRLALLGGVRSGVERGTTSATVAPPQAVSERPSVTTAPSAPSERRR
jgi:hypothetical protein